MELKPFDSLSERQQNILRFMVKYMNEHGFPPTIREIGEATDIKSTSVVNYNLNKLVQAGYIERTDKKSRGLRIVASVPGMPLKAAKVVRMPENIERVPLIGHIVAGEPVAVPEDVSYYYDEDDMLEVPPYLLNGLDPTEVFALRVKGDSMVDAMVGDGDIVLLKHQLTANNGDMVAVWLPDDGETTLKHFYKEGDRIRLQPANPTMQPIYVDARNCEIRGKVLSVIRQLH